MAEPQPAPEPPPDDAPPWERKSEKPAGSLPGGATTGWHDSPRGKSKRPQIAVTVALFCGLLGVLLGLFYFLRTPPREPEFLAIPVSQYGNIPWAANPTADRDSNELLTRFSQAGGRASTNQEVDNLRNLLSFIRKRPDPKSPLILFVSALAIVHDDRAFILPGNARIGGPDAPSTWVPLADLLAAFAECDAEEKALILDIARSPADPFHGVLHDDVAAQIDKELTAFKPAFPVLCSCSPGERSLVIPELGLTAFAAFLSEGLRGEADGYPPSSEPDNKVSFAELAEFTACRVSQCADQVQDVRQMPMRYGPDGRDFILFRGRPRNVPAEGDAPPPPAVPAYPNELREGWKLRDDAKRDLGLMLAPDLVLELETLLLRAEERYLAGTEQYDPRLDPAWKTAVDRLRKRTSLFDSAPVIRASLADHRLGRKDPPAELGQALDKWMRLRFPPKDDAGKPMHVTPAELAKLEDELEKLLAEDRIIDGFAHLWSKLVKDNALTHEKIVNVATILDDDRFRRLPLTSEQLLLRRIATSKMPEAAYPEPVRLLLQSEQAFADAVVATAGRLPEGFRRVRQLLTDGDRLKREGETRLLKMRSNSEDAAAARDTLTEAVKKLLAAQGSASKNQKAHLAWAESAAMLHAYLPGVIATERPPIELWLNVSKLSNELAVLLSSKDGPRDFDALDVAAGKLRSATDLLRLASAERIKTLIQDADKQPQAASLTELQRLLAGAALSSEDRAGIAFGMRKVSSHRYYTARAKWDRDPSKKREEHQRPEDAFLRTQRRANASIDLLRLAAFNDVDKLSGASRGASNDPAKWQALGDQLRTVWSDGKYPWMSVERVVRAGPAKIAGFDPELGFGELFRTEEVERRKWLAERFSEYGKLRENVPDAARFYQLQAGECDTPLPKGGR